MFVQGPLSENKNKILFTLITFIDLTKKIIIIIIPQSMTNRFYKTILYHTRKICDHT